ncbi:MAG: PAS domain-containing protein, partial [Candidatus Nealsonbacteria bacterium]|nr:PAS domain-containing protein [Candidatus Nealsonbacteria bacterium]
MSNASESRKQRTADKALHESEEHLRLLLENMEDMVSRHLPDSTIVYVSPSCQTLTGYAREELVHTRAADYVHPDDVQAVLGAIDDAVARHDGHYRVQHRLMRKDGEYVWVETPGQ